MTTLELLQQQYGQLEAEPLLEAMLREEFVDNIALVSSFGAGSALLLSLVAQVDNNIPVMFLETGKHFPETVEYVDTLKNTLHLTNIRMLEPNPQLLANVDSSGELWQHQPNRCCWLRKVEPLQRALDAEVFEALITGRKRYQTADRANMQTIELHEDGRYRINPLASWTSEKIQAEFAKRNLPEHPLVAQGYPSIGCAPCTRPVKDGEDERAGRWAHTADTDGGKKEECGLHVEGVAVKPDINI